jgi:hypothetical protein
MSLDPFGAFADHWGSLSVEDVLLDGAFEAATEMRREIDSRARLRVFKEDDEIVIGVAATDHDSAEALQLEEYGDMEQPGKGTMAMTTKRLGPYASGFAAEALSRAVEL